MNFFQAIAEYLDKARSKIYGIFAFWVMIFTLPVVFVSLFVDQNLIYKATGKLKGQYIIDTFFNFSSWSGWIYSIGIILGAVIMTWLMIAVLPKSLIRWSYGKELEDQAEREFMKITEDEKLNKKKERLADKQLETIAKVKEVVDEQEDLDSREQRTWEKEYTEFKKTELFKDFSLIPESIYNYYGNITVEGFNDRIEFEVPYNLISYADSSGLIKVDVANKKIADLTEKGRYFLMKYQLEQKFNSNKLPF